MGKKKAGTLNC